MADLRARFQLVDEMSGKLEKMSRSGQEVADRFEDMGRSAGAAFDDTEKGVSSVTGAVDGVAQSISEAAERTGHWTDAADKYSKSMLEAVYSTEELVDMGLKSSAALEEQEQMLETCERQAEGLARAVDASADSHSELEKALEDAGDAIKDLSDDEKVSAESKEKLERASEDAADALKELEKAQGDAERAMREYDSVMDSGAASLDDMEAAAEGASRASEALAEANEKASDSAKVLADATQEVSAQAGDAGEAGESAGQSGMDAVQGIAGALAAAGIVDMVKDIGAAAYEMADDFSEAQKIIAARSGETGAELKALQESASELFAGSTAESVEDVASGMMAVQAATQLTGEELEAATEAGMQLENLFGYDMAESSRTVSALMKNFGVTAQEAYDIIATGAQNGADKNGDMLDVLNEYSAQYAALGLSSDEFISSLVEGAEAGVFSIDKVGDAVKEFNIRAKDGSDTTAEAFDILGMNADMMTAKFAAGGDTAKTAFFEVVGALESMEDPVQRNTAAVGLFGTMYEDLEAALLPILSNIEGGSVEVSGALEDAGENAVSMSDKWAKAGNSIKTAFATAIAPTLEEASSGLAGVVESVGNFLQEHPVVTKAITAIGVGLGVVAVGVAGVAASSLTAIPAVAALGTAINAAIWPLTAVAAAIAGVTAAVLILKGSYDEAYDETMSMTAVTAEQTEELENLQTQYDAAVEKYGATSEEASSLKYQIDTLSESLETNGQSMEELSAECDALIEDHQALMQEYDESRKKIEDEELGNLALITRLQELASQTDKTAGSQKEMQAILDELNGSIEGMDVTYEDLINNQEATIESIKKMAEAQAEQQRQQEMYDEYVELLKQEAEEEEHLAELNEEKAAAQERANEAESEYMDYLNQLTAYDTTGMAAISAGWSDQAAAAEATSDALDEVTGRQEEAQTALDETRNRLAEIEAEWDATADAAGGATEETMTYQEAAATAYQSIQGEIEALCASYDSAYQSALTSFQGQFSLFDQASMESEEYMNATIANAQAAMDSQLQYWENYNANLETMKGYSDTLTGEAKANFDALVQYASDGSEQAAGLAQDIATAIQNGDQAAIEHLSETVANVEAQQVQAAETTADFKTNFSNEMDALQQKMNETVANMNLTEEAAASARSTIDSYTAAINDAKGNAVAAAQSVADAVTATLSAANPTINVNVKTTTVTEANAKGTTDAGNVFIAGEEGPELVARPAAAYAGGTTDSTDYFIAGEEGPELIIGEQGSTVFPTEETDRLINSLNEKERSDVQVVNHYETVNSGAGDAADALAGCVNTLAERLSECFKGISPVVEVRPEITVEGTGSEPDLDVVADAVKEIAVVPEMPEFEPEISVINEPQEAQEISVTAEPGTVEIDAEAIAEAVGKAVDIPEVKEPEISVVGGGEDINAITRAISEAVEGIAEAGSETVPGVAAGEVAEPAAVEPVIKESEFNVHDLVEDATYGLFDGLLPSDAGAQYEPESVSVDFGAAADDIRAAVSGLDALEVEPESERVYKPESGVSDALENLVGVLNKEREPLRIAANGDVDSGGDGGSVSEKRITLEIVGGGSIEVTGDGRISKEGVLEVLYDNLKPVLMNIIQGEMFEEGDLSYEY